MSFQAGWRRMAPADLAAVMRIAAAVHPDYPEDEVVFAERLRLAPEGCHVLAGGGGDLLGYLVSHPWPAGVVPALNSLLGAIPPGTRNWYIHDLALLPQARGTGAAPAIVARLAARAQDAGFGAMSLVAVNGSVGFWEKQGFRIEPGDAALAAKLASYGGDARFMVRALRQEL